MGFSHKRLRSAATLEEVRQGKLLTTALYLVNQQARRVRPLMVLLDYPRLKATNLTGIAAPTLVLAGEKDVIHPAHILLIASILLHERAHIFSGLTHYAPTRTRPPSMRRCWPFWRSPSRQG